MSGEPIQAQQRHVDMKCWVEGSRQPWAVCEHGMVTLDWETGHCVLDTVPATQKGEGSLDKHSKGTVATLIPKHRNRDSHCNEHSTAGKAYMHFR